MEDDVIRIPGANVWLGSCSVCGKGVWSSDKQSVLVDDKPVYKCFQCHRIWKEEQLVPF
jgi:hypothetical protein